MKNPVKTLQHFVLSTIINAKNVHSLTSYVPKTIHRNMTQVIVYK